MKNKNKGRTHGHRIHVFNLNTELHTKYISFSALVNSENIHKIPNTTLKIFHKNNIVKHGSYIISKDDEFAIERIESMLEILQHKEFTKNTSRLNSYKFRSRIFVLNNNFNIIEIHEGLIKELATKYKTSQGSIKSNLSRFRKRIPSYIKSGLNGNNFKSIGLRVCYEHDYEYLKSLL